MRNLNEGSLLRIGVAVFFSFVFLYSSRCPWLGGRDKGIWGWQALGGKGGKQAGLMCFGALDGDLTYFSQFSAAESTGYFLF